MPSRAAGAVKDDVKFDLNKLSKGPPDQPGMAWETKEGEVSIVYSRLVHLSFCHFDGNYTVYFNIIYILYTVYTHIHYIASKAVFLFSQPMCFTVHHQLLEIR